MSEKHIEVTVSFLCDPDELEWVLRHLDDDDNVSLVCNHAVIGPDHLKVRSILVDGNSPND